MGETVEPDADRPDGVNVGVQLPGLRVAMTVRVSVTVRL